MPRYGRWARRGTKGLLPWVVAAAFLLALVASGAGAAVGTTFVVNSTQGGATPQNDGLTSFADAIIAANANPDKDTIAFDIPGAGPHVIVLPALASSFPFVTDAVVIDGFSEPDYAGTPVIEIDASDRGAFGLLVIGDDSAGTEVRGIAIYGGDSGNDYAIDFDNPGRNIVARNFVGTDATGTVAKGAGGLNFRGTGSSDNTIEDNVIAAKGGTAVFFEGVSDSQVQRNRIGTDATGEKGISGGVGIGIVLRGGSSRNLLKGNVVSARNTGIAISGSTGLASDDNRVEGNKVGTDIDGTDIDGIDINDPADDLGNSTTGITVAGIAHGTIIGGGDAADLNVISGNHTSGVCIGCGLGDGGDTVIQGNFIGTDISGTTDLGNGVNDLGSGIGITQTRGLTLVVDNVVSGNDGRGISGGTAVGNVRIEHNLVGTSAAGTAAIPNDREGVLISTALPGSVIGGETAEQRNVIAGNLGDGVSVGDGVDVLNNYVGTNKVGDVALGNGGNGISIFGTGTNLGRPGAGNLISGNGRHGVLLGSERTLLQGNRIGTNAQGTAPLGNGEAGITTTCCYRDIRIGGEASGEGNLVSGNGAWGIDFLGSGAGNALVVVEGNRIGTNDAGTAPIANGAGGVHIENTNAFLKLLSNVVSGNSGDGVDVEAVGFDTTELFGNRIGTNDAGTAAIPNTQNGVRLGRASLGGKIFVGGLPPSQRNIISGNGANGIVVANGGHTIVGNFVGIDRDGANAVPNTLSGLRVQVAPNEVHDNVFSGNGQDGVELLLSAQTLTRNLVGTGADGSSRLGNSRHGVLIEGSGAVTQHVVGGQAGDGNTIAFNGGHGVFVRRAHGNLVKRNTIFSNEGDGVAVVGVPPSGAIDNTISENSIFSNGGLGIDLQDDGLTANDSGDGDGGSGFAGLANFLQNFPVNLQVSADGTSVTGTLNSRPNTTYRVELFGNSVGVACDPTGSGEGERFLKAKDDVVTDASGNAPFSVPLDAPLAAGEFVSATATNLSGTFSGNTSEFSQCVNPPRGTLVVRKVTVPSPDASNTSFAFTAGGGLSPASFSLKNGESRTFGDLVPRAGYSLAENPPAGWDLTSSCSDGSPVSNVDIGPGETVTCTFTNTKRGTLIVNKVTNPSPDPTDTSFAFAAGGGLTPTAFNLKNGGSRTFANLVPKAGYSVAETTPPGWDTTSTCNDGSPVSNMDVGPGETVTCTFTNTKRGAVTLKKTTNGVVDPSKDIVFVLTGPGLPSTGASRSTFGDQDGVLDFGSGNLVAGQTYKMCETPVPAGFTSFWKLDGVIVPPYNPDASKSPPEDLGARCYDFQVSSGQVRSFEVDNARPGGDPRTIGYWKNWNRCTGGNQAATAQKNGGAAAGFFLVEDLVSQFIGDFTVTSCEQAVKLLSKQDQAGKAKSSDAAYELGAQLLAARFNLAAGAETCAAVQQAVLDSQTLLDQIDLTGSGDYLGSKSKDARRAQALALAAALDRYNNGNLC